MRDFASSAGHVSARVWLEYFTAGDSVSGPWARSACSPACRHVPGGLALAPRPAGPAAGCVPDADVRSTRFVGVRCRPSGPAPPESISGAHPGREAAPVFGVGLPRPLASTTSPHLRSVARWGEVFLVRDLRASQAVKEAADQGMQPAAPANATPVPGCALVRHPAARSKAWLQPQHGGRSCIQPLHGVERIRQP